MSRAPTIDPFFRVFIYIFPWLAGPIFIRLPESTLLVTTVLTQQFWYLGFCASCFGLCSIILQAFYGDRTKRGTGATVIFGLTVLFLLGGFLLTLEGVGSKLDERVFFAMLTLLPSFFLYLWSRYRSFNAGRIVAIFLLSYLASLLSIITYSGLVAWPGFLVSVSFALLVTSFESFLLRENRLASAFLVLAPLPIAWLVSVQQLSFHYLMAGFMYLPLFKLLEAARDQTKPPRELAQHSARAAFVFACLLIIPRLL